MTELFFDIETIPSQLEWVKEEIKKNIKPHGNCKTDESKQKWFDKNLESAADEEWRKTSLNGAVGEVVCISYAVGNKEVKTISRGLGESEKDLLAHFNLVASKIISPKWIGHYITGFDLRFIWQRSIIHGLHCEAPYNAKPWDSNVFDTKTEFSGINKGYGSLDMMAKIFGIEGKLEGMDGSKVWDEVKAGNIDKVVAYCEQDVEITRELYRRMT